MAWPTLATLLLLAVNDFALKGSAAPRWLTGKMSDFTGLFALPIVIVSIAELVGGRVMRWSATLWVVGFISSLFAAMKTNQTVARLVGDVWSVILLRPAHPVRIAADRSDLAALVACVAVPFFVNSRKPAAEIS